MGMKIVIGADIVPTKSNYELFRNGNVKELIGEELYQCLDKADYVIMNLEVPLTNEEKSITKYGPCLKASIETIEGLKRINSGFYSLSNNHILDQGEQGLFSTIETLETNGIDFAGAGRNLQDASALFVKDIKGKSIGIYCCAEHEFSIATETQAGANPYDPLVSFDHVEELKKKSDYVIVLYHGGKEHYRYPSPKLQKICRKMIGSGADMVICQHSHCIGCEEEYNMGKIVYGQGNFLFDGNSSEYWKTSLLIQVDENFKVSYLPIVKQGNGVRMADPEEANKILTEFAKRSEEIKTPGFIEEKYEELAERMLDIYFSAMAGKGKRNYIYRILNKITNYKWRHFLWSWIYRKHERVVIENFIECESQYELFLTGLKKSI